MAWSAPRTWVASETLTAALLNQELRDNLNAAFPVGSLHWFMQSETSVATPIGGFALEANGVAVGRTTYSALNTVLSGLSYPFGSGDGSTTCNLPDLRGRSAWMCGSNAACDIGDNDGVTESSRQPKHQHTESLSGSSAGLSITGSPGGTFVTAVNVTNDAQFVEGATNFVKSLTAPTGSPTAGTLAVAGTVSISGTVGSGMSGSDAVAHLFVGVMGVKY